LFKNKDKVDETVLYSEKALEEETRTESLIQPDQSVQTKALAGLNANYLFPEVEKISPWEGVKQTTYTHLLICVCIPLGIIH
jgi:hypothetical protein